MLANLKAPQINIGCAYDTELDKSETALAATYSK
jgi:hypothetical protein